MARRSSARHHGKPLLPRPRRDQRRHTFWRHLRYNAASTAPGATVCVRQHASSRLRPMAPWPSRRPREQSLLHRDQDHQGSTGDSKKGASWLAQPCTQRALPCLLAPAAVIAVTLHLSISMVHPVLSCAFRTDVWRCTKGGMWESGVFPRLHSAVSWQIWAQDVTAQTPFSSAQVQQLLVGLDWCSVSLSQHLGPSRKGHGSQHHVATDCEQSLVPGQHGLRACILITLSLQQHTALVCPCLLSVNLAEPRASTLLPGIIARCMGV
jgi:hypothetical protein